MQVLGLPSRIHKGNCGGGTALGLLTSSSLLLYNNIYIYIYIFIFFFGGRVGMQKNSRETNRSQKQEKGNRSIANQGLLQTKIYLY